MRPEDFGTLVVVLALFAVIAIAVNFLPVGP